MAKNSQVGLEPISHRTFCNLIKLPHKRTRIEGYERLSFGLLRTGKDEIACQSRPIAGKPRTSPRPRASFKHNLETHVADRSWCHHQASQLDAFSCRSKRRESNDGIGRTIRAACLMFQGKGIAERDVQQSLQACDELRRAVGFSVADEVDKLDRLKRQARLAMTNLPARRSAAT